MENKIANPEESVYTDVLNKYYNGERDAKILEILSKIKAGDNMNYSYAMGVNDSIKELEQKGFIIQKTGESYKVSFSKEKEQIWEKYISKNLQRGYWNEYLKENEVVFLFHLDKGIKKYIVKDYQNDEVLKLCEELAETKFKSLKDMLKENEFYKDKIER